jgi:hypothetical protein
MVLRADLEFHRFDFTQASLRAKPLTSALIFICYMGCRVHSKSFLFTISKGGVRAPMWAQWGQRLRDTVEGDLAVKTSPS